MKKLSKHILTILLTCIILISSSVVSFAGDEGDPGGKCIIAPPINIIKYSK